MSYIKSSCNLLLRILFRIALFGGTMVICSGVFILLFSQFFPWLLSADLIWDPNVFMSEGVEIVKVGSVAAAIGALLSALHFRLFPMAQPKDVGNGRATDVLGQFAAASAFWSSFLIGALGLSFMRYAAPPLGPDGVVREFISFFGFGLMLLCTSLVGMSLSKLSSVLPTSIRQRWPELGVGAVFLGCGLALFLLGFLIARMTDDGIVLATGFFLLLQGSLCVIVGLIARVVLMVCRSDAVDRPPSGA